MNKKETSNPKEARNQNYEDKKMNTSENSKKKKDKDLPWWVELLFIQIGSVSYTHLTMPTILLV